MAGSAQGLQIAQVVVARIVVDVVHMVGRAHDAALAAFPAQGFT
jgi:hypothetical protein